MNLAKVKTKYAVISALRNQLNNGSAKKRREAGMDDTGYCDMQMVADWKLDMMAKTLLMQLWGERREAVRLACKIIHECYCMDKPVNVDYSATRAKITRTEEKIATLIDLLMEGDISKDEYKTRRDKLETELQTAKTLLADKTEVDPIPQEEKLRWNEIEKTLDQMIDFSGDRINEDVLDKFIRRVVPLGNNRYAFHLNLDNGFTDNFNACVEGRKNKAAVSFEDGKGDGEPSPIHSVFTDRLLRGVQSLKKPVSKNGLKSRFFENLFFCILTAQSGLSRRQTGDRHPEGGAGDVV